MRWFNVYLQLMQTGRRTETHFHFRYPRPVPGSVSCWFIKCVLAYVVLNCLILLHYRQRSVTLNNRAMGPNALEKLFWASITFLFHRGYQTNTDPVSSWLGTNSLSGKSHGSQLFKPLKNQADTEHILAHISTCKRIWHTHTHTLMILCGASVLVKASVYFTWLTGDHKHKSHLFVYPYTVLLN